MFYACFCQNVGFQVHALPQAHCIGPYGVLYEYTTYFLRNPLS
jgi:hypothetical protein